MNFYRTQVIPCRFAKVAPVLIAVANEPRHCCQSRHQLDTISNPPRPSIPTTVVNLAVAATSRSSAAKVYEHPREKVPGVSKNSAHKIRASPVLTRTAKSARDDDWSTHFIAPPKTHRKLSLVCSRGRKVQRYRKPCFSICIPNALSLNGKFADGGT